jgi:hypothetical protein
LASGRIKRDIPHPPPGNCVAALLNEEMTPEVRQSALLRGLHAGKLEMTAST